MIRKTVAAGLTALMFAGAGTALLQASSDTTRTGATVLTGDATLQAVERRGGLAVITAKLTPAGATAQTVTLQMFDGDRATLSLPGHPDTKFHFSRNGQQIVARVEG